MNKIQGMNDCVVACKSNAGASVVYPPRQTAYTLYITLYLTLYILCKCCVFTASDCRIYTVVYSTPVFSTLPLYIYTLYTLVYIHTDLRPQTYTAAVVHLLCQCMHQLRPWNVNRSSVFVCVTLATWQPKTVSNPVIYDVHQSNVCLYDILWKAVAHARLDYNGLTLIGEYFEPPRSLLGISIRSDAM